MLRIFLLSVYWSHFGTCTSNLNHIGRLPKRQRSPEVGTATKRFVTSRENRLLEKTPRDVGNQIMCHLYTARLSLYGRVENAHFGRAVVDYCKMRDVVVSEDFVNSWVEGLAHIDCMDERIARELGRISRMFNSNQVIKTGSHSSDLTNYALGSAWIHRYIKEEKVSELQILIWFQYAFNHSGRINYLKGMACLDRMVWAEYFSDMRLAYCS